MVVFGREDKMRARAEAFLSVVRKGPESEKGYSINKALKRWHRDVGSGSGPKHDEEKELWKSLRLKRNERGEVVVFF
jgi:cell growth-regulating nucleolar protein